VTTYRGAMAALPRGKSGLHYSAEEREERRIAFERARAEWCDECQRAHVREERMEKLRGLLPIAADEIREVVQSRWPCFYGEIVGQGSDHAGVGRWRRDMRGIGAVVVDGEWRIGK